MSIVAIQWAQSLCVGNPHAKSLLLFLANQNFNKPGFEFSRVTYCRVLEISEATLKRAMKLLEDKKLIIRIARYDKKGRQIANELHLNIPDEFIQNYEKNLQRSPTLLVDEIKKNVDKSDMVGAHSEPPGGSQRTPRGLRVSPTPSKKPRFYDVDSTTCRASAFANNNINNKLNNKNQEHFSFSENQKHKKKPTQIKQHIENWLCKNQEGRGVNQTNEVKHGSEKITL